MKKILLLFDCSSEFDRKILHGLTNYSKENGPWLFYRMPPLRNNSDGAHDVIEWARKWGADAIVGRWQYEDTRVLSELGIPIVIQNYTGRSEIFSNLTGDYFGTGALAADHFLSQGYTNFAYFGFKNVIWSEERLLGFKRVVESHRLSVDSLMIDDLAADWSTVSEWVKSLPKPAALFACDDDCALNLSELCKLNNVAIPDDIALMGVDNDEVLCQISDPKISSISLDTEEGGYRLGQMLQKQFDSNSVWSFNVVIKPCEIIQRGSTLKYRIKDHNVATVMNYIEENFDRPITMSDIVAQVPLCRRSIEIRFKEEFHDQSIYKYLMDLRMGKFASLLEKSNLTISEIADKCGMTNSLNISRIFKQRYGCSPFEYRKRFRSVEESKRQD